MRSTIALLLLSIAPASAGVFDQFEDIGELTSHLLSGGVPRDGIPAMTNPQFVSADQASSWVGDANIVIGVVINGEAKAYPEQLGWRHEIVNDQVGGQFVSVTLCPLTGTPQVFDATAPDGSQIEFGVSGLLLNTNLVMYDRRDNESLYPQMVYTGINGRFKGERLTLLPAIVTTFGMWKKMYPDAGVAQFGTGLHNYSTGRQEAYNNPDLFQVYPYNDYRTNNGYFIAPLTTRRPDLSVYFAKEIVTGVCINETLRAYPFADMIPQAVVNDTLGGEPLLIAFDLESRTSIPYSRRVGDRVLNFYQVEAIGDLALEYKDIETGTRWDLLGRAIDGPLTGSQLEQLPAYNSMWFAWNTYWPESSVYVAGDGILDEPTITAVLEPSGSAVPSDLQLEQNYPNPFNPTTRIRFTLPSAAGVSLRVYNVAGQQIASLADGPHRAGFYDVAWDGTDDSGRAVASGTYVYHLEVDGASVESRRMTLTR